MHPKVYDDRMFFAVIMSTVLCASFFLLDQDRNIHETHFVDAIPPAEFLPEPIKQRQPSNAPLKAAELVRTRPYKHLNRMERRQIYNAVIFFCNEDRDDRFCRTYVKYCGASCQPLVQGSLPAAR